MELLPIPTRRVSPNSIILDNGDVEMPAESIYEILHHHGCQKETQKHGKDGSTSVGFSFKLLGFCYRIMGLLVYSRRCTRDGNGDHFVFSWRHTWLSVVYSSFIWIAVILCFCIAIVSFTQSRMDNPSIRTRFHIALVIYRSTGYLMGVAVMVCQAPKIAKLVQSLTHLERDLQMEKCELRIVVTASVLLVLFQFAIAIRGAVMIVGYREINLFCLAYHSKAEIPLKILAVVWAVVTSYGQTMVQGTLIFLCVFFRVCFKRLNKDIEDLGKGKPFNEEIDSDEDQALKLVRLRLLYERTVQEVSLWQNRLAMGILGSYCANLVLCCFGISIAITDTDGEESFLFWEIFVLGLLHLISPTIASGLMKNEIANFRLTMRSEMAVFSGAGIFDLDFPLILSIVQSIITYAVLLLQTTNTSGNGKQQNETILITEDNQ